MLFLMLYGWYVFACCTVGWPLASMSIELWPTDVSTWGILGYVLFPRSALLGKPGKNDFCFIRDMGVFDKYGEKDETGCHVYTLANMMVWPARLAFNLCLLATIVPGLYLRNWCKKFQKT